MHCTTINGLLWIMLIMQVQAFTHSVFRTRLMGLLRPSFNGNWNTVGRQQSKWQTNSLRFMGSRRSVSKDFNTQLNARSNRVIITNAERDQLFQAARERNHSQAMEAYDAMLASGRKVSEEEHCAAMSVCFKGEHIPRALQIAEQLKKNNPKFHEVVYLTLIRCYSAANQLSVAMQVLKKIPKIEMRPRYFQPMLEALKHNQDLHATLQLIQYMHTLDIFCREDQLATLLQTCSTPNVRLQLQSDPKLRQLLHTALATLSEALIGVDAATIVDVVRAYTQQTKDEVVNDGVLVRSVDDIQGTILSTTQLETNSTVTAMNAVFGMDHGIGLEVNVAAFLKEKSIVNPADIDAQIQFVEEKYQVRQLCASSKAKATKHNMKFGTDMVLTTNGTQTIYGPALTQPTPAATITTTVPVIDSQPLRNVTHPARIVDISHSSCMCPNCNGTFTPLPLSEGERQEVLDALLHRVGVTNKAHLEEFNEFLCSRPEYEYIVDAANVAYQNQNFKEGRFSFTQIEQVYDTLRAQQLHFSSTNTTPPTTPPATSTPPRVLVIIPEAYAQPTGSRIPNNARISPHNDNKFKFSTVTQDDERILKKLHQAGALYVTPRSTNDDIFWLYATLYNRTAPASTNTNALDEDTATDATSPSTPNTAITSTSTSTSTIISRKYPGLVVSNDLMRDHKLHAFEQSRVFMRWRTQHIVNFVSRFGDKALQEGGELSLFPPSKISREIQESSAQGYWHVPCTDRNVWLCVHAVPGSSTSSGNNDNPMVDGETNSELGVDSDTNSDTSDGSDDSSDESSSDSGDSSDSSNDNSSDSSDSDADPDADRKERSSNILRRRRSASTVSRSLL